MSFNILSPGLLTTVQDLGRHGYQKQGILVSGAMDAIALRVANLLVGNPEDSAGLEITYLGPRIRFEADHLIALTGADLSPVLNGERVKMARPVWVRRGSVLEFSTPRSGIRAYLAVAGSFAIPKVLGSYSTYLRAEIGGFRGRALKTGDLLPCIGLTPQGHKLWQALAGAYPAKDWGQAKWTPDPQLYPQPVASPVIRVLQGPDYELFTESSQHDFWHQEFTVTSDSDRMGYRLQGPALFRDEPRELLSSAVTFGTIQVPPEGHPIALLADHQTTGGYPRIAQVITADFSRLAQVPLGQKIRFQRISLEDAQCLYIKQEQDIQQIKKSLQFKIENA
ncbi:5-oxoprolinase subunit C family protein [Hymenobacter jejuensis]|uniref:Biotin-dependent carboxyltransferase family protein n=1 Tax=Hymenobacter jejuensis TaxID=2502781 RepID=A0A5B8A476_9BACT|nr:biotin-dependent carboxyltransferase family protein [Hymenobacter jejuensis]QDA62160.1 biotin-dependent carboxyltransferase family protein [Hymenobacter jejuensis]